MLLSPQANCILSRFIKPNENMSFRTVMCHFNSNSIPMNANETVIVPHTFPTYRANNCNGHSIHFLVLLALLLTMIIIFY